MHVNELRLLSSRLARLRPHDEPSLRSLRSDLSGLRRDFELQHNDQLADMVQGAVLLLRALDGLASPAFEDVREAARLALDAVREIARSPRPAAEPEPAAEQDESVEQPTIEPVDESSTDGAAPDDPPAPLPWSRESLQALSSLPLGELLVREGKVEQAEVDRALKMHQMSLRRLGDLLVESGAVSRTEIDNVIERQQLFRFWAASGKDKPEGK